MFLGRVARQNNDRLRILAVVARHGVNGEAHRLAVVFPARANGHACRPVFGKDLTKHLHDLSAIGQFDQFEPSELHRVCAESIHQSAEILDAQLPIKLDDRIRHQPFQNAQLLTQLRIFGAQRR
ncbi:MAG: hypothetical protein KDE24_11165, partial [Caldilinea sp.]|nr:hypothetical protein [Caldilinea sp.]